MSVLRNKERYLSLMDEIRPIAEKAECFTENIKALKSAIQSKELLIPVVGEFSAGKSSFLNSFIGRPLLSIAITPETAVATELRYSVEEYAEVLMLDGSVKRISLAQTKEVEPDWRCLRLYINSENLKKIAPIILVDMPGFDSPRDDHNKAILSYLDKGAHYIVLTSVESGTITASMSRQLQDIQNMGRDFSFFVSKADLRSPDDVLDVVNEIKDQIEDVLGVQAEPKSIGKNAGEELSKLVDSIDPDLLFERIFKDPILQLFDEVESSISVKIAGYKLDRSKNEQIIMEMNDALEKLAKRKNALMLENKSNGYETEVDGIVNAAGSALSSNVDHLVDMAANGAGNDAVSQEINSIVRSAVIPATNKLTADISKNISSQFQLELKELNSVFEKLGAPMLLSKISDMTSTWGDAAKTSLMKFSATAQKKAAATGANAIYKTTVGALGIATSVLAPVVEIIILMLPEILSFLFKGSKEKKQKAQIRSQILSSIPKLKQDLRSQIKPLIEDQQSQAIEQIADEYDQKIQVQRENIRQVQEKQKQESDVDGKIQTLEELKVELLNLKQFFC